MGLFAEMRSRDVCVTWLFIDLLIVLKLFLHEHTHKSDSCIEIHSDWSIDNLLSFDDINHIKSFS